MKSCIQTSQARLTPWRAAEYEQIINTSLLRGRIRVQQSVGFQLNVGFTDYKFTQNRNGIRFGLS